MRSPRTDPGAAADGAPQGPLAIAVGADRGHPERTRRSAAEELATLTELCERGVLSEAEFALAAQQALARAAGAAAGSARRQQSPEPLDAPRGPAAAPGGSGDTAQPRAGRQAVAWVVAAVLALLVLASLVTALATS